MKSYTAGDHDAYESERKAYSRLHESNKPCDNILQCHGTYTYSKGSSLIHNIILEYADGGSLWDFYKKTPPPSTLQDIKKLYTSFTGLFIALEKLRNEDFRGNDAVR